MALRCAGLPAMIAAIFYGTLALHAQSTRTHDLGVGKLLVAHRDSQDRAFAETVIILVHYDHDGTVGLMVNRRSRVPISRALDGWKGTAGYADPIYVGGPVEPRNVLALLKANVMPEGASHVSDKIYLISTKSVLEKTLTGRAEPEQFRAYVGYCGWGPRQLENEIEHGFWHIFAGNADLVFDSQPDTLWSRLIARVGQNIAEGRLPSPPRSNDRPEMATGRVFLFR